MYRQHCTKDSEDGVQNKRRNVKAFGTYKTSGRQKEDQNWDRTNIRGTLTRRVCDLRRASPVSRTIHSSVFSYRVILKRDRIWFSQNQKGISHLWIHLIKTRNFIASSKLADAGNQKICKFSFLWSIFSANKYRINFETSIADIKLILFPK